MSKLAWRPFLLVPLWDRKAYIGYKMVTPVSKSLNGLQDKNEMLMPCKNKSYKSVVKKPSVYGASVFDPAYMAPYSPPPPWDKKVTIVTLKIQLYQHDSIKT